MSEPSQTPSSPAATRLSTALLADRYYTRHQTGRGHPERPERVNAILDALEEAGLPGRMLAVERRLATEDELLLCHTAGYLATVREDFATGADSLSTGDTAVGPGSLEVALQAVGGVLEAADAVLQGKARNALAVVRPPGHHATPNRGMGFCLFNNVAIAARWAQKTHGVGKVLIADWDVHHGNGTQDIFYEDGSVFFFSTHQSPWYPGTGREDETGEGHGRGATMNCPLPAGSGREQILRVFERKLVPAMEKFRPELVILSAGFDSREGDPLGKFRLTDDDFEDLTRLMHHLAASTAGDRLVSVLEGGYNLAGLASAVAAHARVLCNGA